MNLAGADEPEFDQWRWIDYWDSLRLVVPFKRGVYERALSELAPVISESGAFDSPPLAGKPTVVSSRRPALDTAAG